MKSGATVIYDVWIEPAGDENLFRVTWQDADKNRNSFTGNLRGPMEEVLTRWEDLRHQPAIGQALFRFLDGDARHFSRALEKAFAGGKELQLNLHTCKKTADWPFELIAKNGDFLLFGRIHPVRRVSVRGIESKVSPQNRPLRILFMACDPIDMESGLNYEQEEEAILAITRDLPIEMEVEDSGSLDGLRKRLIQEYYDIVHLSGHANIDGDEKPFFYMEDDRGFMDCVYPDQLWNEALVENPPRLLFLSGCRSGQMASTCGSDYIVSFARLMVEDYDVPAVLGWGRSVRDTQAIHGEKMIYRELSRGKPILAAVQRARHEMQKGFIEMQQKSPDRAQPAWSLLRLYSDGTPLGPIVKEGQRQQPKARQITRVNLLNSRIKAMGEGFVGRRRQLQISLRALNKKNHDKVGVLLLGSGGLGKSCLAGKISERFPGHMVIALQGKLDAISLWAALRKIFHITADKKGLSILARETGMTERLADLCADSFKKRNYILLLDGFQQNLEEDDSGYPGLLRPEAAALLDTLLQCLPFAGKMTHLVIASRYSFTLTEEGRDLVEERLQKIWLTGFRDSEVSRKIQELKNIHGHESPLMREQLKSAGCGNPLLLEKLDRLAGQIPANETGRLQEEIEKMKEDFIRELGFYELYRQCSEPLKRILKELSIYDKPVTEHQIPRIEKVTGITGVECFLREGMNLSLVEHDQAKLTYRLTPLLKGKLKKEFQSKDL